MATLTNADRGKRNLSIGISTINNNDRILVEGGKSISKADFIAVISALLTVNWGSIGGEITDQDDLNAIFADITSVLAGFDVNITSLLTAGYITNEAVNGVFVPFTETTADLDFGTTQKIISKNQQAKDSSGIIFKNNTGDTVLVLGISGGRATTFYGNMIPDTDASRDIGQVASSLQNPNNIYVARSIIINPTVNVTAVSMMDILTDATNKIGQIIKAKSAHTANLSEWRDSANAVLSKITSGGYFISKNYICLSSSYTINNNNTTLNTITGFSFDVEAGKKYTLDANLFVSLPTSVGGKFGIGGTFVAGTIFRVFGECYTTSGWYNGTVTAKGQIFIAGAASTSICRITGTIEVATSGTLTLTFCQYIFSASNTSVLNGSTCKLNQID